MRERDDTAVKVTKEIVVKFIEVGKLSVASFPEVWNKIFSTVKNSLEGLKPEE